MKARGAIALALALLLALALVLLLATRSPDPRCHSLADLSSADLTIEQAEPSVAAAANGSERRICRVRGVARPGPGSRIGFEVWLPARGWTGRYVQLGNGGFAGNIDLPGLAAESARGNAAAMTDTGHRADRFDASWAAGQPARIADYGHRSIQATSDAARALIHAYYGRAPDHRYFVGCSNGGRQALMAAQRYPQDWDGIIAGAPANLWTDQLVGFAALQHHLRTRPGAWISPHAGLAYYRRVTGRAGGSERTRDFYRLFMVPGMAHCQGGIGPTSFGQSLRAPSLADDRRSDLRQALEAWVERDLAPDQLIAAGDGATQELRPSE